MLSNLKKKVLLASAVVGALCVAAVAGLGIAYASSDAPTGSGMVRYAYGLYKSSRSTLDDGESDALRLTSTGLLSVSVEANTANGTDQEVVGNVAHDAADSGNPIKIGAIGRAVWETAASTAADRVNLSADLFGRLRVDAGYTAADAWYIQHAPAANTQATISKAAGAAGVKHVATGFSWSLSSGAGAPTPELITITIRDGATGAGTVMWTETVSLPATAGSSARGGQSGLWLVGTAATALTIETDSAPGANVVANVSLQGVSIK